MKKRSILYASLLSLICTNASADANAQFSLKGGKLIVTNDKSEGAKSRCEHYAEPVFLFVEPRQGKISFSSSRDFRYTQRPNIRVRRATEVTTQDRASNLFANRDPSAGPRWRGNAQWSTDRDVKTMLRGCLSQMGLLLTSGQVSFQFTPGNREVKVDETLRGFKESYGATVVASFQQVALKIGADLVDMTTSSRINDRRRLAKEHTALPETFLGYLKLVSNDFPWSFQAQKSGKAPLDGFLRFHLSFEVHDNRANQG